MDVGGAIGAVASNIRHNHPQGNQLKFIERFTQDPWQGNDVVLIELNSASNEQLSLQSTLCSALIDITTGGKRISERQALDRLGALVDAALSQVATTHKVRRLGGQAASVIAAGAGLTLAVGTVEVRWVE